jgi:hypothetical protein
MVAYVMIGSKLSQIGMFCGDMLPPQLMSSEHYLTMDFVFKSMMTARTRTVQYRYKFTYRFVTNFGINNLIPDPRYR